MMTATTNNQLALHKVLQIKRSIIYGTTFVTSQTNPPILISVASFWLFIHHLRYANRMTSYYRNLDLYLPESQKILMSCYLNSF